MSKARDLADFISDSTIETAELADNAVTSAKLDETDSYTVAGLTTTGAFTSLGIDDNADATAITIDSDERVIIGHTSALSTQGGPLGLQSIGANTTSGLDIFTGGASALPRLNFTRSRNATPGSSTILQDDDRLGLIMFMGDDGTDYQPRGAQILAEVDGTPGVNDMPGRLAFYTTSDGSDSSTERMRITNDGKVGIGETTPDTFLHINGGTENNMLLLESTDDKANITFQDNATTSTNFIGCSGNDLRFGGGGTETFRTDTSTQRVLIGTTSSTVTVGRRLHVQRSGAGTNAGIEIQYNRAGTGAPELDFYKTRGESQDSATLVSNNDPLGHINFFGGDGTDCISKGARISGEVDGTPGSDDMPGRIVFKTASDGANDVTERMRITKNGYVGIGGDPSDFLHVIAGSGQTALSMTRDNTASTGNDFGKIKFINSLGTTMGSIRATSDLNNTNVALRFHTGTGDSEALRIDSSQRVLIGETTADTNVQTFGTDRSPAFQVHTVGSGGVGIYTVNNHDTNSGNGGNITLAREKSTGIIDSNMNIGHVVFAGHDGSSFVRGAAITVVSDDTPGSNDMPGRMEFLTTGNGQSTPTERMRITEGGRVGMGGQTNPQAALHVGSTAANISEPLVIFQYYDTSVASADFLCKMDFPDNDPSDAYYILFTKNETATSIGSVRAATSTSVSFLTTSDHRAKNNVQPLTGALDRLKQLNPVSYNWQDCGTASEGFIAHEAQEVVPVAVMGEKDAVNEDGSPDYQQIDYSKVVPLLTGALQEAVAKIEALEARVAQLEAN